MRKLLRADSWVGDRDVSSVPAKLLWLCSADPVRRGAEQQFDHWALGDRNIPVRTDPNTYPRPCIVYLYCEEDHSVISPPEWLWLGQTRDGR